MTAIVQAFSRASGTEIDVEALKIVVICGVVLVVSLLLLIWSAHLGPAPSTVGPDEMNWIWALDFSAGVNRRARI
jgi:hypothetical protein